MTTILLLVLATDPAAETAASAMAASAADGLEGRAHVELERVNKMPSDDDAVARASVAKANAVIEVSWPDAVHAHLHAHLKPTSAWIDRDVTFEKTSKPWERGRAIGLAIAAMLPEEAPAKVEEVAPAPEPAPVEAPAPVETPSPPKPVVEVRGLMPAASTAAASSAPTKDVPASPSRPTRFDLSLSGELATAFRDPVASTVRLSATYWPSSFLGVRVLGGYRASSLKAADARVTHFDGGLGLATKLFGRTDGLRVVVYGDVRLARELVTRTRLDGVEEQRAHTLPYVALTGEAGYGFTPNFGLIFTAGGELALGKTTLTVRDSAVTNLPGISLTAGLGLRWSY